jgi:hypothetical protein
MDIKVIASTKVGEVVPREELELFGGRAAGVCYMTSSFDELLSEDKDKTRRRIKQTKMGGHHSVYEHGVFSLYLDNVPKIVAMILNNEKQYTTSEKSARYTKMALQPKEQVLYTKWLDIFKNKITKLYAKDYPNFFTPSRIEKLAQENARYLTSVFTPASMVYTTNYRQFNYLIAFIDRFIAKENKNNFETKLAEHLLELSKKLKELPYYDEELTRNEKCRSLSLLSDGRKTEEYFGDVYSTTYKASFAELAQSQRHRTIHHTMSVLEGEFYVPEILRDSESFTELWLSDMKEVADNYPQGTLLEVNEMGTLDAFILKMKERKCTFAQLEVNNVTNEILKKYEYALRMKIHPRAEEIIEYTKGSRCTFPDFKCTAPCGFKLGIDETRRV